MSADDDLNKKLFTTFKEELDGLSNIIVQQIHAGRLAADAELPSLFTRIIQVCRNIKVAAQSVDIPGVARLAAGLEQLFNKDPKEIKSLWDLAESITLGMQQGMLSLYEKGEWPTSLNDLEQELNTFLYNTDGKVDNASGFDVDHIDPLERTGARNQVLEQIKQTFYLELEENNRFLTENLLELEQNTFKGDELQLKIQSMFRAAHNVKGSARGIGLSEIADLAHQLEHNFQDLQLNQAVLNPQWVNDNLQILDAIMRIGSLSQKVKMSNALEETLNHEPITQNDNSHIKTVNPVTNKAKEYDSVRIPLSNLEHISADLEQLHSVKISLQGHLEHFQQIENQYNLIVRLLRKNAYTWEKAVNAPEFNEFSNLLLSLNKEVHATQQSFALTYNDLSLLTTRLQEEIGTARLLPVEIQLAYFPRMVRDLAQTLHKPVIFEMKHNDVKIDKLILDGLKDPLLHLLRNALDHGLESPEQRILFGKSAEGHIFLEISQGDQQVVFKVSDDGAGIDAHKNIQIALNRNLLTRAEVEGLTTKEAIELIFLPGFSSREVVSEISGRGVGLDVVRSNLVQLKGTITVESHPGKGSTFYLRVPITLATEHGVIVRAAGALFVIGTESVDRIVLINTQNKVQVEGKNALLVDGHPLLLCSLAQLLGIKESTNHHEPFSIAVVIEKDKHKIALLVDDVLGERELLLKPLAEPLTTLPGVDGATILGDEQISFILNAHELIRRAQSFLTYNRLVDEL